MMKVVLSVVVDRPDSNFPKKVTTRRSLLL